MTRFPTSGATGHKGVVLYWDVRGLAPYRGKQIKRVHRRREGFEYRILGTKGVFNDIELVLEEIDYLIEKMNDERIG